MEDQTVANIDVKKKELYDQKIRDVYQNVWFPERLLKNISSDQMNRPRHVIINKFTNICKTTTRVGVNYVNVILT